MSNYPGAGSVKHYAAGQGYPQDTPLIPAPHPSEANLSYHCAALGEILKRIDERWEGMRNLADFVAGSQNEVAGKSSLGLTAVPNGLSAEIGERISAIETRLNAIAHEFGRLERAIRN